MLASMQGLDGLKTVGDDISLGGNRVLMKLQGLEGLANITGRLNISRPSRAWAHRMPTDLVLDRSPKVGNGSTRLRA